MTRFGAWMTASLLHFVSAAAPIFGTPLAVGFVVVALDHNELTASFLLRIVVASATAGVVWALLMWPGVLMLARRARKKH
jgi:hypothetical protein